MRNLTILLVSLCAFLSSCNHNDPPLKVNLQINREYLPSTISIDSESLTEEQRKVLFGLVNNKHVINDLSELPSDIIPFGESFRSVNFKEQTLLLQYTLHDWSIDTYSNSFYRNTEEKSYNWVVSIGTSSNLDEDTDNLYLTRFAILVQKLPADVSLHTWLGLSHLNWFPSDK